MGKKIKLALIGLLGFSTACTSVRKSNRTPQEEPQPVERIEQEEPRIMVMYGVRMPDGRMSVPADAVLDSEQESSKSSTDDKE